MASRESGCRQDVTTGWITGLGAVTREMRRDDGSQGVRRWLDCQVGNY